jgi:membrane-associated phospholipid phosphatase
MNRFHTLYHQCFIAQCLRSTPAALLAVLFFLPAHAAGDMQINNWIVHEEAQLTSPPGDTETQVELKALKARIAELDEEDRRNIVHWTGSGPNHRWIQLILENIDKGPPSPLKGRALALMNIAIYDAVATATRAKQQFDRPRPALNTPADSKRSHLSYPSAHAAAAAAASEVLTYLYPDNTERYRSAFSDAARARLDAGLNYPSDIDAGTKIGRRVAAGIIEWAKNDLSDTPFTGERPTGPGVLKGEKFVYPTAGEWRTFAVVSVDNYLPDPPPTHDSQQIQDELKALKAIPQSLPNLMMAWTQHSTKTAYRWWYEQMALAMFESDLQWDALTSAHIYASLSAINQDSITACFNAKYEYWQIRPSQLDSTIKTAFPNPPHPSYPSAHSCSSTTYGVVASHFFPQKKQLFMAAAEAGGQSRLNAGIHYPSDDTAGDMIGQQVAEEGLSFSMTLLNGKDTTN